MTVLLDANVLIALVVDDHVHHGVVEEWFGSLGEPFATCPITQGALVRLLLRGGASSAAAIDVLQGIATATAHEFWADTLSFEQIDLRGVVGHKQVTDAYLAGLARARSSQLATLDQALAVLHPDVALLLDTPT